MADRVEVVARQVAEEMVQTYFPPAIRSVSCALPTATGGARRTREVQSPKLWGQETVLDTTKTESKSRWGKYRLYQPELPGHLELRRTQQSGQEATKSCASFLFVGPLVPDGNIER